MKALIAPFALVIGVSLSLAACSDSHGSGQHAGSTVDAGAGAAISGHYQPSAGNPAPPPPPLPKQ